MVIAGFDPGSSVFGVGIIEKKSTGLEYLFSEEIKFPKTDFNGKMKILLDELDRIFRIYSPDDTSIEEGFLGKNVNSMNVLCKIRGVVLAKAILENRKMQFYSPSEIKIATCGHGNASKDQVNIMVKHIFNIKEEDLGNDESDALAVAYCHSVHNKKVKE